MALTPFSIPGTATGAWLSVVLSLPTSPWLFSPQHQTPPSLNAQVWCQPALIVLTPDGSPDTATGTSLSAVPPSPSWPSLLPPQHQAAPSFSAQVCEPPTLISVTPALDAVEPTRPATGVSANKAPSIVAARINRAVVFDARITPPGRHRQSGWTKDHWLRESWNALRRESTSGPGAIADAAPAARMARGQRAREACVAAANGPCSPGLANGSPSTAET